MSFFASVRPPETDTEATASGGGDSASFGGRDFACSTFTCLGAGFDVEAKAFKDSGALTGAGFMSTFAFRGAVGFGGGGDPPVSTLVC